MRRGLPSALLFGGVAALTAAVFWPWPLRLGREVADLHDPLFQAWGLAWLTHALTEAPWRLFDANILHPHRLTLVRSETLLGLLPLAAPLQALGAGPVAVHNALVLVSFPLTALAMFWLVRHLVGQAGPAVVAALLYAFTGYRFLHLGHLPLLHHEWLPLMLLGLHRALAGGGRWPDVALAAGAFLLLALTSGYYGFIGGFAGLLLLAWAALPTTRPPLAQAAWRGALTAVPLALVVAPLALALVAVRNQDGLARERAEVQGYAAWPSSYLAAPVSHRWLGSVTAPLWRPEAALFPGVVTLVLAAGGVAGALRPPAGGAGAPAAPAGGPAARGARRRPRWPPLLDRALVAALLVTGINALFIGGLIVDLGPVRITQRALAPPLLALAAALVVRRLWNGRPAPLPGLGWLRRLGWPNAPGFYLLLALLAVVCSFGPRLVLPGGRAVKPLYFQLWTLVPGFDTLRVPARFAVLVTTALAILAGYGAARLLARVRSPGRRRAVLALLVGLTLLEAWPTGLPRPAAPELPSAVDRWLAAAPERGAVAILPLYGQPNAHHEAARILGSTAHWRPLVNGYSSFYPRDYSETVAALNTFPSAAARARLEVLGVRWIVVHPGLFPRAAREPLQAALAELPPGLAVVATVDDAVIVEVGVPGPPAP